MKKTYILPIELKETIEREKDIFSSSTGIKLQEKQITAKDVVDIIEKNLKEIENNNIEISFEGEYFTKLDLDKQEELLSSVLPYIKENKISNIIIKTLPQNITKQNLKILRKYKVKTIKMEVASLSNYLLKRAQFSFSYEEIKRATKLIKRFGFYLIYKIYIGLPEATKLDEINTAPIALSQLFAHSSNVIFTVFSSTTSMLFGLQTSDAFPLSTYCWIFHATASASHGLPSLNLTPSLSVIVKVRLSASVSNFSASHGT